MKGIYLCAGFGRVDFEDVVYNDVDEKCKCDIVADALAVDLCGYDFLIATPPCNFYSKANRWWKSSRVAQMTKHLLPCILKKFADTKKPFIVENVKNKVRFEEMGIYEIVKENAIYIQEVGRHTYFTNVLCNLVCEQSQDFTKNGIRLNGRKKTMGGDNVRCVLNNWLATVTR